MSEREIDRDGERKKKQKIQKKGTELEMHFFKR